MMFAPVVEMLAQAPSQQPAPQGGLQSFLLLVMPIMLIMYLLILRPQGREKKRRNEMINKIKKNDRVITIGGVVGTVVSVKDDEITLKVDESNNTKITFLRAAIQRVTAADPVTGALPAAEPKK